MILRRGRGWTLRMWSAGMMRSLRTLQRKGGRCHRRCSADGEHARWLVPRARYWAVHKAMRSTLPTQCCASTRRRRRNTSGMREVAREWARWTSAGARRCASLAHSCVRASRRPPTRQKRSAWYTASHSTMWTIAGGASQGWYHPTKAQATRGLGSARGCTCSRSTRCGATCPRSRACMCRSLASRRRCPQARSRSLLPCASAIGSPFLALAHGATGTIRGSEGGARQRATQPGFPRSCTPTMAAVNITATHVSR
mmetsp:Transcript_40440/g.86250  ORF Transcript_40440/g.86250 Transcript_40440/m.86250 type:complete len:255 (-) Transcript_40440:296-1060(-)